jgi:hypothetical protein
MLRLSARHRHSHCDDHLLTDDSTGGGWLGHKNIQHIVRYTELAPDRFKNFWR